MNIMATTMVKLAVFYVTAPTREVAVQISNILIANKLAACCQIVDKIQSIYFWQGKVADDT